MTRPGIESRSPRQLANTLLLRLMILDICNIFNDIRGAYDKFPDFFHMGTFIDSTHMKLVLFEVITPAAMHLLYCSTTSGRLHGSPLVWACQWPLSQPLSSPQLSHNNSLWALGIRKSHREQGLDYREGEELSWCPFWSNSLWQGWSCIVLVEMPLTRFEEYCPLPTESLPKLP